MSPTVIFGDLSHQVIDLCVIGNIADIGFKRSCARGFWNCSGLELLPLSRAIVMMTVAPASAHFPAAALPMPDEALVISTTFPPLPFQCGQSKVRDQGGAPSNPKGATRRCRAEELQCWFPSVRGWSRGSRSESDS